MGATAEIKEFINILTKAKRNFRLYPSNNPIYISTVEDMYSRVTLILGPVDQITFTFKQYDIYFDGEVVYHNECRDDNLALFFFKDGIREISFLHNIPKNEIEEFMRIISSDFETQAVDDDIVTLLWEKDFQFINYMVDDTMLVEDQGFEDAAVQQVKEGTSDTEGIMGAYEEVLEQREAHDVTIVPLSKEDLDTIIQEINSDPPDKTPVIASILVEMFAFAKGKGEFEEIVTSIKNTLIYAVNNTHMEVVVDCLSRIRNAAEKNLYGDEAVSYLRKIDFFINAERFIRHFSEALDKGNEFPGDVLKKLASFFNQRAIPHFIATLGKLKNESSKRVVISILSELGRKDISLIAKGLSDARCYVVKNIIYILGEIGDRSAIEHLIRVARHDDRRVRREAVRVLGKLGAKDVLHVLKDCMSDTEEIVRITTVRTIGEINSPLSKKIILEKINDKNFVDVNFYEKKEVFEALSHWKERDVIDPLRKIIKKHVFFGRSKYDEVKAAAAYCLGLIGDKDSVEILGSVKQSKNKLLRDHVEAAINKIDHGRPG